MVKLDARPDESMFSTWKDLGLSSDVYVFWPECDGKVMISELYSKNKISSVILAPVGTWSNKFGFDIKIPEKWERRKDLTGVEIRITTIAVSAKGYIRSGMILIQF